MGHEEVFVSEGVKLASHLTELLNFFNLEPDGIVHLPNRIPELEVARFSPRYGSDIYSYLSPIGVIRTTLENKMHIVNGFMHNENLPNITQSELIQVKPFLISIDFDELMFR